MHQKSTWPEAQIYVPKQHACMNVPIAQTNSDKVHQNHIYDKHVRYINGLINFCLECSAYIAKHKEVQVIQTKL